jgi:uncharacterized protein (DUF736 family)
MTKNKNHAILFTNNKTNSNQPDYKGSFEFNGKKGQAAAWIKTAKNNQKYLSISFDDNIQSIQTDWKKKNQNKKITVPLEYSSTNLTNINDEQMTAEELIQSNLTTDEKKIERIRKQNMKSLQQQAQNPGVSTVKLGEGKKTKEKNYKRFVKNPWTQS